MKTLSPSWTPIALLPLLFAACGGGDNAREVLTAATDTEVEVTTTSEAPVPSDPPATEAPATTEAAATTVAPVATDAPVTTDASGGDLAAFCGASEQFFIEASALDAIDGDDDAAARLLFGDMAVSLPGAIFNAPSPELAAAPIQMQDVMATLLPAFDTLDYDIDAIDNLPNADEVALALGEFQTIVGQLETFIADDCGADLGALAEAANVLGAQVGSGSVPTDDGPISAGEDTIVVSDDSATISVSVPATWTEIDGAPDGELRQLVAAPDTAAFLAAFDSPGIIIVAGDAPAGGGAEAGAAGLDGLSVSVEADGCQLTADQPYDDGVYLGTERIYSCEGTTAVSRFAGGTNATGDIFWLLGVIYEPGDLQVWDDVTQSFLVD